MTYTITLRDAATNVQLRDLTNDVHDAMIGDTECSFGLPIDLAVAATLVDDFRARTVVVSHDGIATTYLLQRPTLTTHGIRCVAVNPIAVLDADRYSALWSSTSVGDWLAVRPEDTPNRLPDRFEMDTNNRLYIAAKKNEQFFAAAVTGAIGSLHYRVPSGGSRNPVAMQAEWEFLAPTATWKALAQYATASFGFAGLMIASLLGSGVKQTGAFCASFAGNPVMLLDLYYDSPTPTLYSGETGDCYFRLTKIRIATSTANMIATTIAASVAVGTQTVTPVIMANIAIGRQVVINSGASDSEMVTVTAVPTTTTFTAVFAKAHLAGATVRGIVIRDREVVADVLNQAVALNPTLGLSNSPLLITTSDRDYDGLQFDAAAPLDVLAQLAKPNAYTFGVQDDGVLWYGAAQGRAWIVQASDISLSRPIDTLVNQVLVGYENAAGVALVTTQATDAISVAQNGMTRRRIRAAQTTNVREAELIRDTALRDGTRRAVQATITIRRLYDSTGQRWPVDSLSGGDTLTLINLPAALSSPELRAFIVGEVSYFPETDNVEIALDTPEPRLDVLLARLAL